MVSPWASRFVSTLDQKPSGWEERYMRMTSQRCPLSQFRGPLEQGSAVAGDTWALSSPLPIFVKSKWNAALLLWWGSCCHSTAAASRGYSRKLWPTNLDVLKLWPSTETARNMALPSRNMAPHGLRVWEWRRGHCSRTFWVRKRSSRTRLARPSAFPPRCCPQTTHSTFRWGAKG